MRYLIIGLLVLSCSGCGLILGARDQDKDSMFSKMGVYPATRLDLDFLLPDRPANPTDSNTQTSIGASDIIVLIGLTTGLPFSFISDTLLFPYDFYKEAINPCNRADNKDVILNELAKHVKYETQQKHRINNDSNNSKYDDTGVIITQMHQKYNFALVQYSFDNASEKRLSLLAIKDQGVKVKTEYLYDGVDDDPAMIRTIIKKKSKEGIHDMIDCYK